MNISVVIPVYNEEKNIRNLYNELKKVMKSISKNYEIIFVNDGSTDNSLIELKKLRNVKIINLNRNYGQATALDAGFKEANGDLIVSLDGDGQNDPKDIPSLIKKLKKDNLDVVAGYRRKRKDKSSVKILTLISRFLRKLLINDKVHDSGCTLRVYKKEAVKSLDIGGEMHRYILALLRWKGFKIGELEVNHRPRLHGKTKYTYTKSVRGLIDLMYMWFIQKYYQRPLHMFGYLSIISFFFGFISFLESIYAKIIFGLSLNRNGWFFLGIFFFLIGFILFSFGIVIDLLLKIYLNSSNYEKRYYIKEIIKK